MFKVLFQKFQKLLGFSMQKILTSVGIATSLLLSGCSTFDNLTSVMPDALAKTSIVYRQDIQQGNVVTQEQLNKLKPGMAKHQIKYILGTPLLVDVFHTDRWDYYYSMSKDAKIESIQQITLLFRGDHLAGINGDLRPMATQPLQQKSQEIHSVPDYIPEEESLWSQAVRSVSDTVGITDEKDKE